MENLHLTDFPNHFIQIHIKESVGNPKYIFEMFILQNKVTTGFQEAHFGKNIVHTRTFMQAVPFWMQHIFSFLGIHLGQNTSGKISKINFQIFCLQVGPLLEINRFHLNIIWCFVNVSMEWRENISNKYSCDLKTLNRAKNSLSNFSNLSVNSVFFSGRIPVSFRVWKWFRSSSCVWAFQSLILFWMDFMYPYI